MSALHYGEHVLAPETLMYLLQLPNEGLRGLRGRRVKHCLLYSSCLDELVYQNNDFPVNDRTTGWDGMYRGSAINAGVFTWVAEVQYADGVVEVTQGHTTLIK